LHVAGVDIERTITRAEFETWIAPELEEIGACVDGALNAGEPHAKPDIDRVFLTGGSSFVPAVRSAIRKPGSGLPKSKLAISLVSIAYGLALIAQEDDVSRWAA
jgi:hypothetical chaperone protein